MRSQLEIRVCPLLGTTLLASFLLSAASVSAQSVVQTQVGTAHGGRFGSSLVMVPDQNGDGFDDLLVGEPLDDSGGLDCGRVLLVSGKNGSLIWARVGPHPGAQFGHAVARMNYDVDGDGKQDFLVGAPYKWGNLVTTSYGGCYLYSATGSILAEKTGDSVDSRLGWSLDFVNTVGRVVVGSPYHDPSGLTDAGSAYVFSLSPNPQIGYPYVFAQQARIDGTQAGEHCGMSVAGGIDIDSSGFGDFVVGSPDVNIVSFPPLPDAGRVRAYAGSAPYGLLWSKAGAVSGARFGFSVAMLAKANSDSVGDVAVGAPFDDANGIDSGAAYVLNGINGATLLTLTSGLSAGGWGGWSVASAGDINGDGRTDIVVGSPNDSPAVAFSGSARVYSGSTGSVLAIHSGGSSNARIGEAVCGNRDIDNDSRADWAAGAPGTAALGLDTGRVTIRSGAAGTVYLVIDGIPDGDQCGSALAGVGDVDADGVPDYAVGSPHATRSIVGTTIDSTGRVDVRSGATGNIIGTLWGSYPLDFLGSSVAGLGDVDQDGLPDFAIGAPGYNSGDGIVRVHSSASFAVTWDTTAAWSSGSSVGSFLAGVGDLNGDGTPDLVTASSGTPMVFGAYGPLHYKLLGLASSSIAPLGEDTDNDGWGDLILGQATYNVYQGRVLVHSKLGGILLEKSGVGTAGQFGADVVSIEDLNGDGHRDFVVGVPSNNGALLPELRAYASVSGNPLFTYQSPSQDRMGYSLAVVGDLDLDGVADLAAGAPLGGVVDVMSTKTHSRIARIGPGNVSLNFGATTAATGDITLDGVPDLLIGSMSWGLSIESAGKSELWQMRPTGTSFYGNGTPGCAGTERLWTNVVPKVGASNFQIRCDKAPASSLGLLLLTNSQDLLGSDPFGIGVLLHVDLFAASEIYTFDAVSSASGYAAVPVPMPSSPAAAGATYYAQVLWAWGGACPLPPFGLSTSRGLTLQIQP